jgi:hypothetical protein
MPYVRPNIFVGVVTDELLTIRECPTKRWVLAIGKASG